MATSLDKFRRIHWHFVLIKEVSIQNESSRVKDSQFVYCRIAL